MSNTTQAQAIDYAALARAIAGYTMGGRLDNILLHITEEEWEVLNSYHEFHNKEYWNLADDKYDSEDDFIEAIREAIQK